MSLAPSLLTSQQVRQHFPAISDSFGFLDNAGGSQLPTCVINAISAFLVEKYVQIGGGYEMSVAAGRVVTEAHEFMNRFFGGEGIGSVVMGQSTTALMFMLASRLAAAIEPGDEIVIETANHESHIGPWVRLQEKGAVIKFWDGDPVTGVADPDGLDELLNERTKLVCFSQTSNLLGDHQDVGAICKLAQRVGATTIVDVVASASHSLPDVADWGVDFAVLSHYKIYGPHLASLWGKNSCWEQLENPNHFFVPKSAGNFELGCLPYELLAGICAYAEYLCSLAGTAECTREAMRSAYKQMKQLESEPQRLLMSYLLGRSDMRVLGPQSVGNERHPTIGFTHTKWSSKQIADLVNSSGFGMKFGNFYAYRLCESLGIDPVDGVARISLVHYNSVEEVERVMKVLDGVG